ncbi:MAG: tRNA dihydrouridine(20/20a) synthase DusA [Fibrobacteraceae bacterium]|nr:tRNA dihydrouridine(20/20a) synthase DusA [Fibrobacteraceae bacterium]
MTATELNFHRRLSVAPMLDFTDRHERYFLRLLTKETLLYTEMIVANALLHAGPRFLAHNEIEQPVALQLGGSDPKMLTECARIVEDAGFVEVNLNCGCPSERVQCGSFGACLMKEKNLVAECVSAMRAKVKIPVTVKTRIGVDEFNSWEFFLDFIKTVASAGCDTFIIHARTARLKGYTPKENRERPELHYEVVYRLKQELPQLNISINGGITTLENAKEALTHVDGVMMGRAPYANPWLLANADSLIFGRKDSSPATRKALLEAYLPYMQQQLSEGCPLSIMTKHLYGLFSGFPGGRRYRQILSEESPKVEATLDVVRLAMNAVSE